MSLTMNRHRGLMLNQQQYNPYHQQQQSMNQNINNLNSSMQNMNIQSMMNGNTNNMSNVMNSISNQINMYHSPPTNKHNITYKPSYDSYPNTSTIYNQPQSQSPMNQQQQQQQSSSDLDSTNLYIKGLWKNCSQVELDDLFKTFGVICQSRVYGDGVGFVRFETGSQAAQAITHMNGRKPERCSEMLLVKRAFKKQRLNKRYVRVGEDEVEMIMNKNTNNVYLRCLPNGFTEQDLIDLCSPYGELTCTRLRESGVAFVRYRTSNDALNAIREMNGKSFENQMEKLLAKLANSDPFQPKIGFQSKKYGYPNEDESQLALDQEEIIHQRQISQQQNENSRRITQNNRCNHRYKNTTDVIPFQKQSNTGYYQQYDRQQHYQYPSQYTYNLQQQQQYQQQMNLFLQQQQQQTHTHTQYQQSPMGNSYQQMYGYPSSHSYIDNNPHMIHNHMIVSPSKMNTNVMYVNTTAVAESQHNTPSYNYSQPQTYQWSNATVAQVTSPLSKQHQQQQYQQVMNVPSTVVNDDTTVPVKNKVSLPMLTADDGRISNTSNSSGAESVKKAINLLKINTDDTIILTPNLTPDTMQNDTIPIVKSKKSVHKSPSPFTQTLYTMVQNTAKFKRKQYSINENLISPPISDISFCSSLPSVISGVSGLIAGVKSSTSAVAPSSLKTRAHTAVNTVNVENESIHSLGTLNSSSFSRAASAVLYESAGSNDGTPCMLNIAKNTYGNRNIPAAIAAGSSSSSSGSIIDDDISSSMIAEYVNDKKCVKGEGGCGANPYSVEKAITDEIFSLIQKWYPDKGPKLTGMFLSEHNQNSCERYLANIVILKQKMSIYDNILRFNSNPSVGEMVDNKCSSEEFGGNVGHSTEL